MKHRTKLGLKRIITSVLLTFTLLFTCFSSAIAAPQNFGSFTLEFQDNIATGSLNNSRGYDLSGIKVDIYDSVLDRYESEIGGYLYAHNYVSSVYTTTDGTASFKKPSDLFLIMIDLATLPSGTGIDKGTVFYHDVSLRNGSLNVSEIDNIKVSYDDAVEGGVRVDIWNANGDTLKADYTVTPNVFANARVGLLDKTHQISGTVTVGRFIESYEFTVPNTGDPLEIVADALEANRITPEQAFDYYMEILEFGDIGFSGTNIASRLLALYEDKVLFNQLPLDKQEILKTIISPDPTRAWQSYTSDRFVIFYDDANTSGTPPQMVQDIAQALKDTRDKFVGSEPTKYNEPKTVTTSGNNYYYVTVNIGPITPYSEVYGLCKQISGGINSEIELYRLGSLDGNISDLTKAVIAHEYFHAIINEYKRLNSLYEWFKESYATWAMHQMVNKINYTEHTSRINAFLGTPGTSLMSTTAPYGAGLFPLYIHTYYGGGTSADTVIKNIVSSIGSTSEINAIINALSGSFPLRFSQFWADTYVPHVTYSKYAITSGGNAWNSKPTTKPYSSPISATSNYLACQFFDFNTPIPGSYASITMNITSGIPSNLKSIAILKFTNGTIATSDFSSTSSTFTYYLYIPTGFTFTNGSIAAVNVDTANSVNYTLTIS